MFIVATTPFGGLLALFCAVPLGIVVGIYGAECAAALRHHASRSKPGRSLSDWR